MKKYVWLDLNTGKFSNSFTPEEVGKLLTEKDIREAKEEGWKLISYVCENDEEFEFYCNMQINHVKNL